MQLCSSLLTGSPLSLNTPYSSWCQPSRGRLLDDQQISTRDERSEQQPPRNQPSRVQLPRYQTTNCQPPNVQPSGSQLRGDQLSGNQPQRTQISTVNQSTNDQPLDNGQYSRNNSSKNQSGTNQLSKDPRYSKRSPHMISLCDLRENSAIWRPDNDTIESWIRDPSIFWISSTCAATFDDGLASVYDNTLTLESRQVVDVLRLRFSYVFFYDLLIFLYPHQNSHSSKASFKQIAELISQSRSDDYSIEKMTEISLKIKQWVTKGRRYHKLTETFDDGILIELPVNASRHWHDIFNWLCFCTNLFNRVENRLPLDDETAYKYAVCDIVKLKLKEKAASNGAKKLATQIRKSILTPFCFLRENPVIMSSALDQGVLSSRIIKRSSKPKLTTFNDTTRLQHLLTAAQLYGSESTTSTSQSIHPTASNFSSTDSNPSQNSIVRSRADTQWTGFNVDGTQPSVMSLNVDNYFNYVWECNPDNYLE